MHAFQHVWRVSTATNRNGHVSFLSQREKRLREHIFVAFVIGVRHHCRDTIVKTDNAQAWPVRHARVFREVARHVRGGSAAAAIPKNENSLTVFLSFAQDGCNFHHYLARGV